MTKLPLFFSALLLVSFIQTSLHAFTPPGASESFVYPSPVTGDYAYLAFSMAEYGQAHILVYNETGSLVMDQQRSFSPGVQQVILSNFLFANGAYVYLIYANYDSGNSEKMFGKFAVMH